MQLNKMVFPDGLSVVAQREVLSELDKRLTPEAKDGLVISSVNPRYGTAENDELVALLDDVQLAAHGVFCHVLSTRNEVAGTTLGALLAIRRLLKNSCRNAEIMAGNLEELG